MKVSVKEFGAAVLSFEAEVLGTMEKRRNKFAYGIAMSVLNDKVSPLIEKMADGDGMIDCDALKKHIDAGMDACGGSFDISPDISPALGPIATAFGIDVETTIGRADVNKFFNETIVKIAKAAADAAN